MRRLLGLAPLLLACNSSSTNTDAGNPRAVPDAAKVNDLGAEASVDAGEKPDVQQLPPYVDPYACAPAAGPRALDDSLDASEARAGVITNERELIGGEAAAGRIGHLRIYNNRVRVIVQGRVRANSPQRASGYNLYGGNIIDMDVVRPAGAPGGDVFREMFGVVGYRISDAAEVTVACDGSGGRPAAIRVVGRDVPTRLINILDGLARERDVRIVTHYILRPNSSVLEARTEVQSNTNNSVPTSVAGEFYGAGSALTLFTDATGFGDATRAVAPPRYLVAVSDPGENNRRVSYAVAPASGTMSVPVVDASGTVAIYPSISAMAGQPVSFTRYFSIGTGDVSSVVEPLMGPLTHAHIAVVRAAVSEPHSQASHSATEYNIRCTAYGRVHGHETDDADGHAVAAAVARPELRSESRIVELRLQQGNTCDCS